jgi:thiamine biosynthesis lipoprotein
MTKRRIITCLLILLLAVGAVVGGLLFGQQPREFSSDQFLMDTLVSIKAYGTDSEKLRQAVTAAYAEMHRISDLADRFPQPGTAAHEASDVCRINAQAGIQPVRVHKEILEMLELARKYRVPSAGAFDATIGPAMDLWGFGGNGPRVPPPRKLAEALKLVDCNALEINEENQSVFLRKKGMKLDLGAVAKGYATEKALLVLKEHGIRQALIDAGGNIRVLGKNSRNAPWRIGIKDPRKADAMVAVLSLENSSAVTSGDYYRYFEAGGKRYHHILDPRTGYPATGTMSATAVTEDAGLADVLSTAFFVMKPEQALAMAEKMAGVDLFLVTADRRILHTSGLRGRIEVTAGEGYRYDQGR